MYLISGFLRLYTYVWGCHFLVWSLLHRISHFKPLPKVSLRNNHFHFPNIFNFFLIKPLIFHFETALDVFNERPNPFCFPFCMTAGPSLSLLALGNRPEDQRQSENRNHSLTQEFKKFKPQEKPSVLWKRTQKCWSGIINRESTILFLWLLCINSYFFSTEKKSQLLFT